MADPCPRCGYVLSADVFRGPCENIPQKLWSKNKYFFRKESLFSPRSEPATSGVDEKPVSEMLNLSWIQVIEKPAL